MTEITIKSLELSLKMIQETISDICSKYEYMSEEEQQAFDLGETYHKASMAKDELYSALAEIRKEDTKKNRPTRRQP